MNRRVWPEGPEARVCKGKPRHELEPARSKGDAAPVTSQSAYLSHALEMGVLEGNCWKWPGWEPRGLDRGTLQMDGIPGGAEGAPPAEADCGST